MTNVWRGVPNVLEERLDDRYKNPGSGANGLLGQGITHVESGSGGVGVFFLNPHFLKSQAFAT